MKGSKNDLINYRLSRSLETIKEAEIMYDNGFYNASVNRIYYACYYAVSALLYKKGIETSTHKGIRQMFGLHFVQTGIFQKDLAKYFSDLYDRRQTSDYDDFIQYDMETSINLISLGKAFVEEVKKIIDDLN